MKESAQDFELERLISAYIDARAAWLNSAVAGGDLVSQGESFEASKAQALSFSTILAGHLLPCGARCPSCWTLMISIQ
ncbi:hypothetical protein [Neorhizobium sp. DT-125]|uniref:hypothetical protein n=1 Tax=Neorhizobium sp. DT-125 TaxID=3396163 RepID=UPI003F1E3E39